jgi:hypothetical protein
VEEADSWVTQNGAKILPHLLRRIDPSDNEMVQLVQSGMLPFDRGLLEPREFIVRLATRPCAAPSTVGCHYRKLAATSLALTELITSLLAANRSFGADAIMPIGTGCRRLGGLFRNGHRFDLLWVGFTRRVRNRCNFCSRHSRDGGPHGRDRLTLNWQKRSSENGRSAGERAKAVAERGRADADRARADDRKIEVDTIGQELDNEIKRLQLGNLPAQAEAHRAEKPATPPASFFVPSALIVRSSQDNGLAPAHGVHLVNRGLPSLLAILRVMPGLLITVENSAS